MSRFTVQRYCARNDTNGNPRRVFVIRDEAGTIVATVDEGYAGRRAFIDAVTALMMPDADYWNHQYGTRWLDAITDLGDVDVAPGIYRRMVKWQVTKP